MISPDKGSLSACMVREPWTTPGCSTARPVPAASARYWPSTRRGEWQLLAELPRRAGVLAGATCTLINGQSLTAEYLWYGHGYDSDESDAFFERVQATAALPAAAMLGILGATFQASPQLLNRDNLHLVWQNSLMAENTYWRLMNT